MTSPSLHEPFSSSHSLNLLQSLRTEAEKTVKAVKKSLGNVKGRLARQVSNPNLRKLLPSHVTRHIHVTQQLSHVIRSIQEEGQIQLSKKDIQLLEESQHLIVQLGQRVHHSQFLQALIPIHETPFCDQHRLLASSGSSQAQMIPTSHREWSLHLGLLMRVYQRTKDPQLKKEIGFLAVNYLAKAAPYCFDDPALDSLAQDKLTHMFHHGLIEPKMISYNRESPVFDKYLSPYFKQTLAFLTNHPFFIIDTKHIEELLPTWFSVIRTKKTNQESEWRSQWAEQIVQLIDPSIEQAVNTHFVDYLKPLLLLDLTPFLEDCLMTSCQDKLQALRLCLDKAIQDAVKSLASKYPQKFQTEKELQQLTVYMRSNIACVCRGELKEVGFLSLVSLFNRQEDLILPANSSILEKNEAEQRPDYAARNLLENNLREAYEKIEDFISGTGIRLSSVAGRAALLEFMTLEELLELHEQPCVHYAIPGPNEMFFATPLQITETHLFKRFETKLAEQELLTRYPYLKALGCSTLQLVRGLLYEMKRDKWSQLNTNLDTRQLVQNSLFRLLQHLTKAENHLTHFGKFTQAIELAHNEMASLLKLFAPFAAQDFSAIYTQQLRVIPDELKAYVKAGLTKSSMNTLAGVQVALSKLFKHPCRVYQQEAHFEIVLSMGRDYALKDALQLSSLEQPHLYVADFNHNINLDPAHNEYQASDVKSEVAALLKAKPKTEQLTVAIDCTIDYVNSPRVAEFLTHFSQEIQKGRLNVIVFRSGQKFDMLGMDNYYGSPFYMINNGSKQWETFNETMTHEAFKTDLLSTQWFCLVNKYAPQSLDDYRRLIFDNTRRILAQVPDSLKPGNPSPVKVATVAKGMDPCFIDMKILGNQALHEVDHFIDLLYQKFVEKQAKIHMRGGYGSYHPNVGSFPILTAQPMQGRVLRINPGLNQEEADIIIEFLQDLNQLYSSTVSVHSMASS